MIALNEANNLYKEQNKSSRLICPQREWFRLDHGADAGRQTTADNVNKLTWWGERGEKQSIASIPLEREKGGKVRKIERGIYLFSLSLSSHRKTTTVSMLWTQFHLRFL